MNKLFLEILNVQSETYNTEKMAEYIVDHCFERGYDVEYLDGNIYVTKGKSKTYPCIISHTDTVHTIIPDADYMVVHDDNIAMAYDIKKMAVTGIGGDDKVGIYICLRMLEDLPYCKAAFFRDEECGCLGSAVADLKFFDDARFILQCDRKGNSDFVSDIFNMDLYDEGFGNDILPIITKYGYSETSGGLTDVYQLAKDGVGVAVANMSCGYYNPHCDDEMINLHDVENCRQMVYEIMTTLRHVYGYKHKQNVYKSTYKTTKYDKYYDWYDDKIEDRWTDYEYKGGKWTKKIDSLYEIKECWSCSLDYHADDLNEHGMCEACVDYHLELMTTSDNSII